MAGDPLKKGRYTEYSNKIGLFDKNNKQFIGNSPEVVLSFPFKDAVLEAGMTKEDAGREERFLNIKIDTKDIDTLEDPKVLTNFKYIDKDGEKELDENSDIEFFDENGELKQNLLIKGNNLLALHTLKEKMSGQVKLIYIDPPYYFDKTKPTDAFRYNSNFKLSAWLTFMKNRLEVARDLLKNNGAILVHIGEDGYAYLKLLMLEIFGKDNFIETFIWKTTDNPDSLSNKSRSSVEYIIAFEKKIDKSAVYIGRETENGDVPLLNTGNNKKELIFPKGSIHFNIPDQHIFSGKPDRVEILDGFDISNGLNDREVRLVGEFRWTQNTLNEEIEKGTFFIVKSDKFSIRFQRIEGSYMAPEKYIDEQYLSKTIGVGTNEDASAHMKKMGIKFTAPKPESIVAFFVKAITNEGDIVLDFFAGSGTTQATALKMRRRFIGIEQMDYIETDTKKRIKAAIDGEQGEISPLVNWHGGGSFVYCELKKYNQDFIDRIMEAITIPELEEIYEDMQKNAFLKFFFDKNEFEKDENFRSKNLDERKQLLVDILDENQFYLNLSEMNDTKYKVTNAERVLTEKFYQIKEDEVEDDEE